MCPSRFQQAYFLGTQKFRTGASGDPVTLNGNPQEPPLCGMQEDTPVKWWPGPKGFPSPKPSLTSIYLTLTWRGWNASICPPFFFLEWNSFFKQNFKQNPAEAMELIWTWGQQEPLLHLPPLPRGRRGARLSSPAVTLSSYYAPVIFPNSLSATSLEVGRAKLKAVLRSAYYLK